MRYKNIIALIPARGGSKSVHKKNIHPLGGKPLIAYSIETALSVDEIHRVIVSSDDDTIGSIARKYGAEYYKRPDHLATDDALTIDTIRDIIEQLRNEKYIPGIIVLLEPTCPFRTAATVKKSIHMITAEYYHSVATFSEADVNPHRAWKIVESSPELFIPDANPWLPRQKLPPAYALNGAVYAFSVAAFSNKNDGPGLFFGKTGVIVTDKYEAVDINTELDFEIAETILKKVYGNR